MGAGGWGLGAGGSGVTAAVPALLTDATIELTRALMAKDINANTLAIVMPCSRNKILFFLLA